MRYFLLFVCFIPCSLSAQLSFIKFNYISQENCTCETDRDSTFSEILALSIIQSGEIKDPRKKACYYQQLGGYYYDAKKGDQKAITKYKDAIKIREKYRDGQLWKSYRNIGIAYKRLGYYKKALDFFDKIEEPKKDILTYRYISECYTKLGEHKKAIDASEAAIKFAKENKLKGFQIGDTYNRYCISLIESKYPENLYSAVVQADKAISFFDSDDYKGIAPALNNKGNAHRWLKQYSMAIQSYEEALAIQKKALRKAETLNNIATALYGQGKYQQAINILKKSLQLKKNRYEDAQFRYTYAANHENLAENYEALGNIDEALKNYQLALINIIDSFRNENINTNPGVKDSLYIYNKPDLLRVLDLKAQAALKSGKTDLAHETYQELDDWITEFYKDLSTNESKLRWIDRAHATYGRAIDVALKKGDKTKAFEYAERAHAVLLWQSLSQQAARSVISDDEDKEKMDDLTAKIRQADQQYRNGEIKVEALRNLERKREALEKTFDEKYPAYAQRKYQPEATTVSDIQSKIIDNQTAFIEYYQTEETLYIFTITKDGLEVTKKNAKELTKDITDFVKNISNKNMNEDNYHTLAHKLYQQLIPQSIPSNDKINRLVIVPDREIGTLPFAALATQATSGQLNENTPFLVKKYTTNYLYSAGSYLQLQQKEANQDYCFSGIAPVQYEIEGWDELEHAGKELDEIKSLHWMWQREILKEEEATKAAFKRIMKEEYKTILVSTHAAYGENGGEIIFRDSILTQDEIDVLEVNTHRLILSACKTGVGAQNQGEGILSLGWNFAYKGVPSITMTHWEVKASTTKDIIVSYCENLNKGISADQALAEAQRQYLSGESYSIAEPYYWSGIFHTGNID